MTRLYLPMPFLLLLSCTMSSTQTPFQSFALLAVRITFGARLIYGTADNVFSWERMREFETFLNTNGFPFPLISAMLSVYLQFLAGICWVIGYRVKLSAFIMAWNFVVAIIGVHLLHGDSYLATAPAIHLLVISLLLFATGPGNYSIDKKWGRSVS